MSASYDRIGVGYSITRRTDPGIEARIVNALGDVGSVANVGAGAGSYEPRGPHLRVVALEPSAVMIRQRAPGAPPVIQAVAEALPLATGGVDAALAILTVHHWTDPRRGLAEMRRVARKRVVIFTWDQDAWESFWLIREYLPCIRDLDRPRAVAVAEIRSVLGPCRVLPVPIPFDCRDGFHGAFWRRPKPTSTRGCGLRSPRTPRCRHGSATRVSSGSAPTSRAGAGRPIMETFWTSRSSISGTG